LRAGEAKTGGGTVTAPAVEPAPCSAEPAPGGIGVPKRARS